MIHYPPPFSVVQPALTNSAIAINRLLIINFRFIILSFRLLKSTETVSIHTSKIRIINKKLLFKPFKTDLFNIIYTDFVNIYLKIALKNKKVSIYAVMLDELRERASGCQLARCVGHDAVSAICIIEESI